MWRLFLFKRALMVMAGLFLLFIAEVGIKFWFTESQPQIFSRDPIITHNPINLAQIDSISKFRSCQGHDFSGKSLQGMREQGRSMKHYIAPLESIRNELNKIEIYSPFDGRIAFVVKEEYGSEVTIAAKSDPNWGLIIFHVDLVPNVGLRKEVKSGELIGYANVKDRHDFDFALIRSERATAIQFLKGILTGSHIISWEFFGYYTSPFKFMTDEVLEEYHEAGIETSKMAYSREFRDANPCDFDKAAQYPEDWVTVNH